MSSLIFFVKIIAFRDGGQKEQDVHFDEFTTLQDFRARVMEQVFGIQEGMHLAIHAPYELRLIWRGVTIREGVSCHTGIINDIDLMKDLSPGGTHPLPEIHAHLIGSMPMPEKE